MLDAMEIDASRSAAPSGKASTVAGQHTRSLKIRREATRRFQVDWARTRPIMPVGSKTRSFADQKRIEFFADHVDQHLQAAFSNGGNHLLINAFSIGRLGRNVTRLPIVANGRYDYRPGSKSFAK